MPYNRTGTNGNDTLNQAGDAGPGTVVGLGGDDCIFAGSGLVTVSGDSGNDTVVLQTGNTGTVDGGTQNDSIFTAVAVGSMVLFGGDGLDTINMSAATTRQTILGGNDASDNADSILAGTGDDLVFGNGGNDTLDRKGGNDTLIGGVGNDSIWAPGGTFADLVFGNEGNDTAVADNGNDTVFGGLGNDSLTGVYDAGNNAQYFGNEGADTISLGGGGNLTILGGNDSADGNDLLFSEGGADFIFGNGGADTVVSGAGDDTVVGGFNDDIVNDASGSNIFFGNEGGDTLAVNTGAGTNTMFGGLGNDSIRMSGIGGADTLQGNEGNDTIFGYAGIDTVAGGSGRDVFVYSVASDDGQNAANGGQIELLTDLDWSEDRIQTLNPVTYATDVGARPGANLIAAANNAIAAAFTLSGTQNVRVAAQFTFNGHAYLAINLDTALNTFEDYGDLLIDITGVTGTITTSNFLS